MKEFNFNNKRLQSWIILILVVLNIIAFIFIANKAYVRFDMTEGKKYSISKATKKLLKGIDNTLVIEYYYNDKSKEVSGVAQVIQYVIDMLKEYENYGRGMINVVINELSLQKSSDQALISELEQKGIQQYSLNQTDQAESKSLLGFSGMIISYKEKQAVIPAIFQDQGFEFRIDSEISKLIGGEEKLGVLFTSSNGTYENEFKYVKQVTEKEFNEVRRLMPNQNIPSDITVIIIIGGNNLSDYDILQLDQFLLNGGKAFIAINGVNIVSQQYGVFGQPADSKLIELLSHYGVTINQDLICDNNSYNSVQQGFSLARYPLWIKVKSANINKDNLIVSAIDRINLLWASSITVGEQAKDKAQVLFKTTDKSWAQKDTFQIDVASYKYPVQEGKEKFNLAVSFDGEATSYFKDREIPQNSGTDQFTANKVDIGKTKFVVVGNEQFLQDNFSGNDEFIFLMNALDWLSKDGSLIEIRNKGKFSRPLDKTKDIKLYSFFKTFIITFTTFIVPILFIIMGIIIFVLRNIRNKALHEHYCKKKE